MTHTTAPRCEVGTCILPGKPTRPCPNVAVAAYRYGPDDAFTLFCEEHEARLLAMLEDDPPAPWRKPELVNLTPVWIRRAGLRGYWYTPEEAAKKLGVRTSPTVYEWLREGKLSFEQRRGECRRIYAEDLEVFSGRKKRRRGS